MNAPELLEKIHAAMKFICKPLAVPDAVVLQAAHAAAEVIAKFINETNAEIHEQKSA